MASPKNLKRRRLMGQLMRRMALEVDPEKASYVKLARELDVTLHTVLRWIKVGRTTAMRARALNRRFGDTLANIEVLTEGRAE